MKRCYAKNDKNPDIEFVKKTDGICHRFFCRKLEGSEALLQYKYGILF